MPVPERVTVLVPPDLASLDIVMVPVAAPATVGSKPTSRISDWPGFNAVGKVAPEIANVAPVTVTEFTAKAVFPEEVRVRLLVDLVSRFTLPKSRLMALSVI